MNWKDLKYKYKGLIIGLLLGVIGFFYPPTQLKWVLFIIPFFIVSFLKYLAFFKPMMTYSPWIFLPINMIFYGIIGYISGDLRDKSGKSKMLIFLEIFIILTILLLILVPIILGKPVKLIT